MNQADTARLYAEIEKGIFITYRIYIDPAFTKQQAVNNYVKWLGD
jgi:hypothetical protein